MLKKSHECQKCNEQSWAVVKWVTQKWKWRIKRNNFKMQCKRNDVNFKLTGIVWNSLLPYCVQSLVPLKNVKTWVGDRYTGKWLFTNSWHPIIHWINNVNHAIQWHNSLSLDFLAFLIILYLEILGRYLEQYNN